MPHIICDIIPITVIKPLGEQPVNNRIKLPLKMR